MLKRLLTIITDKNNLEHDMRLIISQLHSYKQNEPEKSKYIPACNTKYGESIQKMCIDLFKEIKK